MSPDVSGAKTEGPYDSQIIRQMPTGNATADFAQDRTGNFRP
jgi:hypothetical protein